MPASNLKYRFKRLDSLGALAAEDDEEFLQEAFVDTGYLAALRDCRNSRSIVLGRTGSGKTALLSQLCKVEERVVQLQPESLALAYLSNSTILQYLSVLGVNLDVFFRLLWRHVFVVEIIKKKAALNSKKAHNAFLSLFRTQSIKHQRALDYLEKWGSSFWEETDYRIKEVTQRLEENLKSELGTDFNLLKCGISAATSCSAEQKAEIVQRAQRVVNSVQIKELSEIMDLLADLLSENPQKNYFITIDRLDENWIEDSLRCKLIRALIETIRDFRKVSQAKIIIALRWDLLDRVYRITRDNGFQEEKYESLYLTVDWSRSDLLALLEKRINFLIKRRYTDQRVTYGEILPSRVGQEKGPDYFIERTLMRPRDAISFFNCW